MKSRILTCITAMIVFAALAIAVRLRLAAQEQPTTQEALSTQAEQAQHTRYKLIDLGTLGGPASYFSNGADGILNNQGTAAGWADTSTPDPYPAFCFNTDCFVSHAFQSRNGVLTDLGALPGSASSLAFWISANGLIAGISQNGEIDPLVAGLPEIRGVLWKDGKIIDLGTLEGGHESLATSVNSSGQVVGAFNNAISDPFSLFGSAYQARAYLWQNGAMQDLGTLGGPDAFAFYVNERGGVSGFSYTNSTPNATTGLPTADPFLFEKDNMLDLGTLGGTFGVPTAFNNRDEVVGQSNLAGDLILHPFLWTKSRGMQDLGTLGGDTGFTNWINDAGDIAGKADLPGPLPQNHDAVLWRHGTMIDLGALPGDSCSNAYYVNSRGQVVGTSESRELCLIPTGEHAFLWEDGGPMIDLNTLIPPGSGLELTFAFAINDRGEIVGTGVPPGCAPQDQETCGHAYVLIPCGSDTEGCRDNAEVTTATTQNNPAPVARATQAPTTLTEIRPTPRQRVASFRARLAQRYHLPGLTTGPRD